MPWVLRSWNHPCPKVCPQSALTFSCCKGLSTNRCWSLGQVAFVMLTLLDISSYNKRKHGKQLKAHVLKLISEGSKIKYHLRGASPLCAPLHASPSSCTHRKSEPEPKIHQSMGTRLHMYRVPLQRCTTSGWANLASNRFNRSLLLQQNCHVQDKWWPTLWVAGHWIHIASAHPLLHLDAHGATHLAVWTWKTPPWGVGLCCWSGISQLLLEKAIWV